MADVAGDCRTSVSPTVTRAHPRESHNTYQDEELLGNKMQFCDECGSMMRVEDGEMVCTDCGATDRKDEELAAAFTSTESQTDEGLIESEAEANFEGKPTADDVTCEECGHGEAWYTIKQTASADEPPTRFFKCTDCGYRWREYN